MNNRQLADALSSLLVGAVVMYALKQLLPTAPAVLVGVLVSVAHERFDAPLARAITGA